MRNFDLQMGSDMLQDCTSYRISRSSKAYSYFLCEFRSIYRTEDGSLIVPPSDKVESRTHRTMHRLMDRLGGRDHSIKIQAGSPEQLFFQSEYCHSFVEDRDHNTIVPEDEYPSRSRCRR